MSMLMNTPQSRAQHIDALTNGMSATTAGLVRSAIRRAINRAWLLDALRAEYADLFHRIGCLQHSHAPGVADSECPRCQAEAEEQRILGALESCTAALRWQR